MSVKKTKFSYTEKSFASINSLEKIKEYLSSGGDINAFDCNGMTLLCHYNCPVDIEVLTFLLNRGLDINATNCYGQNALFFQREYAILKWLIDSGCSINQKDDFNNYPIILCLKELQKFKLFINSGFDINKKDFWIFEYNPSEDVFKYALSQALELNRKDKIHAINYVSNKNIAKMIIKNKLTFDLSGESKKYFSKNITSMSDKIFDIYMQAGLYIEHLGFHDITLDKMKSIAKFSPLSLKEKDSSGNNILQFHFFKKNIALIDFLLSQGIDINGRNYNNHCLFHFVEDLTTAQFLIDRGACIPKDWENYRSEKIKKIYMAQEEKKILSNNMENYTQKNNPRL